MHKIIVCSDYHKFMLTSVNDALVVLDKFSYKDSGNLTDFSFKGLLWDVFGWFTKQKWNLPSIPHIFMYFTTMCETKNILSLTKITFDDTTLSDSEPIESTLNQHPV